VLSPWGGLTEDFPEAVKWSRKAADQGDSTGQNSLGVCYPKGQGVTKDEVEAVKWYRKAAEQNYAPAQYLLGQRKRPILTIDTIWRL
jgi:uncharacterized protein